MLYFYESFLTFLVPSKGGSGWSDLRREKSSWARAGTLGIQFLQYLAKPQSLHSWYLAVGRTTVPGLCLDQGVIPDLK